MKIAGIDPKLLPPEQVLVLPRLGGNITFHARGIPDMDEFLKLCPEPMPASILTPDGAKPDTTAPGYLSDLKEHNKKRWAYMVVKSLEPSAIEWDTVHLDQPATWANWSADLKANGLTQSECNRVFNLMLEANSLDEDKLQKAREVFLLGRQQEATA